MPLRVLMVTSGLPHPPTSGAAIRISQFARHLAIRHRLTLLSYGGTDQQAAAAELRAMGMEVVLVPPPNRSLKRISQMISLVSSRSYLGSMFHSESLQWELEAQMAAVAYDVVVVEGSLLMCHQIPSGTLLVLDEHNLEFEALARTARVETSPLRRWFNAVEASKFKREELAAWARANLCLFPSEREVELALQLSPDMAAVAIANGVDLDYFQPGKGDVDTASMVFTGTMAYRPNVDAVHHFVRDILPHIHRLRPDAVLTVVGAGVPPSIRRLAGPRVIVTGRVPDVRPYLERAAVVVVPLRIGSGTRLKVLEAFAMGKATVSSAVGCEGLECVAGEHIEVADDARVFAARVVRLLNDRAAAQAMGARARTLAERIYGWPSITAEMGSALEAVAARASRRLLEAEAG